MRRPRQRPPPSMSLSFGAIERDTYITHIQPEPPTACTSTSTSNASQQLPYIKRLFPSQPPLPPTKTGQPQLRPVYRGMRKAHTSVLFQARTGCIGRLTGVPTPGRSAGISRGARVSMQTRRKPNSGALVRWFKTYHDHHLDELKIMIDIMALRQSYERREITEIRWIYGEDKPSDAMTKAMPNRALKRFVLTNQLTTCVFVCLCLRWTPGDKRKVCQCGYTLRPPYIGQFPILSGSGCPICFFSQTPFSQTIQATGAR